MKENHWKGEYNGSGIYLSIFLRPHVVLRSVAWFIFMLFFGGGGCILKILHFIHLAITQGIFHVKMLNSQNMKCTGFVENQCEHKSVLSRYETPLGSSGYHSVMFRKGRMNLSEASPDTFSFSQETFIQSDLKRGNRQQDSVDLWHGEVQANLPTPVSRRTSCQNGGEHKPSWSRDCHFLILNYPSHPHTPTPHDSAARVLHTDAHVHSVVRTDKPVKPLHSLLLLVHTLWR